MPGYASYPNLRAALDSELARLPNQQLETALYRQNIDAEAMEGWLSTLAGIGKAVLPAVGGIAGSFIGGPIGASVGSSLGNLAGGALGGLAGQPSPAPAAHPSMPVPSQMPGFAPTTGGSPAAGQLLQTIARPETLQALMSMFLGPLGRQNISVGGVQVPTGAFTNLLGTLANQAASENNTALISHREGLPRYMQDFAGEAKGDPAIAEHRAAALYELLEASSTEAEWRPSYRTAPLESAESEYDAMDLADISDFAEDLS